MPRILLLCAFVVWGCGASAPSARTPSTTTPSATILFCAFGGVGMVPSPVPPGYETLFAEVVIAIDHTGEAMPLAVTGAALTDASGQPLSSMQRVVQTVVLPRIEPESATMGRFAVYLNPEGTPFDGTLPAGHTILRTRVSLDHGAAAFPDRCRLQLEAGGTRIEATGRVDGVWPT